MTNMQSSGFHVVEINGNEGQTIIYWIVGLIILFVIAGEIRVWYKHQHDPATRFRKKREKEQRPLEHLEMEEEVNRRTQDLMRMGRAAMGGATRHPSTRPNLDNCPRYRDCLLYTSPSPRD